MEGVSLAGKWCYGVIYGTSAEGLLYAGVEPRSFKDDPLSTQDAKRGRGWREADQVAEMYEDWMMARVKEVNLQVADPEHWTLEEVSSPHPSLPPCPYQVDVHMPQHKLADMHEADVHKLHDRGMFGSLQKNQLCVPPRHICTAFSGL